MTCNPTTPGDGRWTCETCGADLGTSEGKAAPDFARCPQPFRGPEFDEGDPAGDWLRSVDSLDADDVPAPVPLDELSVMIREDGELAETPALALLDEIQALRKALRGAAQSLTTLSTAGARNSDSGLDDMIDVRGYASSRAKVAWAALGCAS